MANKYFMSKGTYPAFPHKGQLFCGDYTSEDKKFVYICAVESINGIGNFSTTADPFIEVIGKDLEIVKLLYSRKK